MCDDSSARLVPGYATLLTASDHIPFPFAFPLSFADLAP